MERCKKCNRLIINISFMSNRFRILLFIGLLSIFSCKVEETEEKATNDPEIVQFDKNKMIDSINTSETSNRLNKYNSILI